MKMVDKIGMVMDWVAFALVLGGVAFFSPYGPGFIGLGAGWLLANALKYRKVAPVIGGKNE